MRKLLFIVFSLLALWSCAQTNATFNNLDVRNVTKLRGQLFLYNLTPQVIAKTDMEILFKNTNTDNVYFTTLADLSDSLSIVNFWTRTAGSLYPTTITDSVGIGTINPSEMFHVKGNSYLDGNVTTTANYYFPTTSSTVGIVLQNNKRILHTYTDDITKPNLFLGEEAGNFTMAGAGIAGNYNIGIGYRSLYATTSGYDNTAVGYNSMAALTEGLDNTAVGSAALTAITTGDFNVAVGRNALASNLIGDAAVAIGTDALSNATVGGSVAIGHSSQSNCTDGYSNISMGYRSLDYNVSGRFNVALGHYSMLGVSTKSQYGNTAVGFESMKSIGDRGDYNTALGYQAGYSNITGDNNVFLGYQAGYSELGSNKLYIENSNSATPLIYGDFANDYVNIVSKLLIGGSLASPNEVLDVKGNADIDDTLFVNHIEEQEPDHFFLDYVSTGADTIGGASPGTDIAIATRYIWAKYAIGLLDVESDGFTYIATDTIQYTGTDNAHIKFEVAMTVTGGNAEDWEFAVWNVTDNAIVPSWTARTTTGATNLQGLTIIAYDVNADKSDKYCIKVRNLTNTDDLTVFYTSWYGYVKHY